MKNIRLSALALLLSCSSDDAKNPGGGGTVACDYPNNPLFHYCVEVPTGAGTQNGCVQGGGTELSSCPAGTVGTCTYMLGNVTYKAFFYEGVTQGAIESVCHDGVFVPGDSQSDASTGSSPDAPPTGTHLRGPNDTPFLWSVNYFGCTNWFGIATAEQQQAIDQLGYDRTPCPDPYRNAAPDAGSLGYRALGMCFVPDMMSGFHTIYGADYIGFVGYDHNVVTGAPLTRDGLVQSCNDISGSIGWVDGYAP